MIGAAVRRVSLSAAGAVVRTHVSRGPFILLSPTELSWVIL